MEKGERLRVKFPAALAPFGALCRSVEHDERTRRSLKILEMFTTTIAATAAYNARMVRLPNPVPVSFSPLQHARVCFFLAIILFLLAAGAFYWNESAHYHIYLGLGLVFAVLGFAPLVMHALHHKSK